MLKKLFSVLICLCFCASSAGAEEIATLYLIKKAKKSDIDSTINDYLTQNKIKYVLRGAYYIPVKASKNASVFLTKQVANDCYLYYFTDEESLTDIRNAVLTELKENKYKYKTVKNKSLNQIFYSDAAAYKDRMAKYKVNSKKQLSYDFSDEAQAEFDNNKSFNNINKKGTKLVGTDKSVISSPQSQTFQPVSTYPVPQTSNHKTLKGIITQVPAGANFDATLQSTINSASLAKNDKITAILDSDWIYRGLLIAPAGSILYGTATDAKQAGYAYGSGSMEITFNEILTPKGTKIAMVTNRVFLKAESHRTAKIITNVVIGCALGLAGAILIAAINGDKNYGKALAIGSIAGGASGAVYAAAHKGENVEIPEGEALRIKLTQPMTVSPYN